MYQFYVQTLDRDTADFQNQVMSHHYEEVKSVYLNMRGWRHDYHNHIQTMKAYLQLKQYTQLESYLNELEADLSSVDQLVKSGNLMMDAILNSKLSLAKEHQIEIHCKAVTPESLCISDIDICVMIGNLMDNAIEACDQIPPDKRRIRVYTDIVHQQFYLSVTNSANENISEDQKRYISEKRGNHGHGMKRVKLTVDKYDGYLNLKNEPGVFVSELMIPLN
ncbi:GHKL domain-containing protein [Clostridiaceae bacterium DONG20-135]|uniref:GHKL domain-containing protein n=1 Tax=Copranaerobaculum intestinale TaxID=2692629 RepID=A0A6N8UCP1_9FIRM|nr:GHKL domain-containing protein [Copranaerobaculum intestinale]MXQ74259.1 GHKL domain-containing protein [Copranaerobaculum intestinale]